MPGFAVWFVLRIAQVRTQPDGPLSPDVLGWNDVPHVFQDQIHGHVIERVAPVRTPAPLHGAPIAPPAFSDRGLHLHAGKLSAADASRIRGSIRVALGFVHPANRH